VRTRDAESGRGRVVFSGVGSSGIGGAGEGVEGTGDAMLGIMVGGFWMVWWLRLRFGVDLKDSEWGWGGVERRRWLSHDRLELLDGLITG